MVLPTNKRDTIGSLYLFGVFLFFSVGKGMYAMYAMYEAYATYATYAKYAKYGSGG